MASEAQIRANRENAKKAGRKKGYKAIQAEKAREYLVKRVAAELDPILTAQIESAKGLYYEKLTPEGEIKVYKDKPDINAGKYLTDQTVGKAKETVEMSGKDGGAIPVDLSLIIKKVYGSDK